MKQDHMATSRGQAGHVTLKLQAASKEKAFRSVTYRNKQKTETTVILTGGATAMKLLLGSGGLRTAERVQFFTEQVRSFFRPMSRLLFVPCALADHDGYVHKLIERGLHAGYQVEGIHRHADPVTAIHSAEGLFVGGGNTFRLLAELYRHGLLDVIRERVRDG